MLATFSFSSDYNKSQFALLYFQERISESAKVGKNLNVLCIKVFKDIRARSMTSLTQFDEICLPAGAVAGVRYSAQHSRSTSCNLQKALHTGRRAHSLTLKVN